MTEVDDFWEIVDAQLLELKTAKSADDVLAILSRERNPYRDHDMVSGDGFFAGGGGDATPADPLYEAGWTTIWFEAPYYWALRSPDGESAITYVEGDVYRGDRKAA